MHAVVGVYKRQRAFNIKVRRVASWEAMNQTRRKNQTATRRWSHNDQRTIGAGTEIDHTVGCVPNVEGIDDTTHTYTNAYTGGHAVNNMLQTYVNIDV